MGFVVEQLVSKTTGSKGGPRGGTGSSAGKRMAFRQIRQRYGRVITSYIHAYAVRIEPDAFVPHFAAGNVGGGQGMTKEPKNEGRKSGLFVHGYDLLENQRSIDTGFGKTKSSSGRPSGFTLKIPDICFVINNIAACPRKGLPAKAYYPGTPGRQNGSRRATFQRTETSIKQTIATPDSGRRCDSTPLKLIAA